MKIGDKAFGGIYVGDHNGHHIICSPIEYDLPCRVNWYQVAEYCKSIGMELPTKEELALLYELYKSSPEYFPKRVHHWYWSSTESSSTFARYQYFDGSIQGTASKTYYGYVRAVRRVKIDTRTRKLI